MPRRARGLVALGLHLAESGPLAKISLIVAGVLTLGMLALAITMARGGGRALADVPGLSAKLLAWGAGVLLAFAVAVHALRRDRTEGVRSLVEARGGSTRAYLVCRVGGLVATLVLAVGGGTLLVGIAAVALASRGTLRNVLQSSGASLAYALAFAMTLGPLAVATLGARSRAGGYLWLFTVLVAPDLVEGWVDELVPSAWQHLASIPGALGVLRASLMPGTADAARLARALVVLAIVVALSLWAIGRQLARVDREASS